MYAIRSYYAVALKPMRRTTSYPRLAGGLAGSWIVGRLEFYMAAAKIMQF